MTTFSIIQISQLEGAHRLDAEFYCVSNDLQCKFVIGKDAIEFAQYGTSKELNESGRGFRILRLNEFEDFFIIEPSKYCDNIDEKTFKELSLKSGDILICRTNGNPKLVGKAAIVMEDAEIAFASYLFRVRPKKEIINSASLVSFLNSRFGRSQIERFLMPSIQSNFSPAQFRAIKIPILPKDVQDEIEGLVKNSYTFKNKAKNFYSQAENLLLEELGLKDFSIDKSLFSIVNFSDIKNTGRMDAEYFQPKYEKLISKIKNQNSKLLPEVIENVSAKFNPLAESDKLFKYVELSNIDSSIGIISGFSETSGREAPGRAKRILKTGDVIVSSVEGSLGKVALVDEEQEGHLASTGFFQFRSEDILPEVILVMAKSIIFKMQLEQQCAGTILTAVPKEAINNIYVPVLNKETQQKIADLICQSHEARKKAKELLEEAKRKVEEMIEKGGEKDGKI